METASYVAMSQQRVLEQQMEVIANNLANASTTGFKRQQTVFEQYLQQGLNNQKVAYVRDAGTSRDTHQGDLHVTGNTLDVALEGDGYLTIATADGVRYSRDGCFQLTQQGGLVNAQGNAVLDDRGNPITFTQPIGKVVISPTGAISANGVPVSKLGIVKFDNQQQLIDEPNNLYSTDATPQPDAATQVRQGLLEGSNVQSVVELTSLLKVQGAYSDVVQVLTSENTRLGSAIDKLARVA